MKDAQVLLFPSVWYEGFPVVIAEAYALGLPVIASRLGKHGLADQVSSHGTLLLPQQPRGLGCTSDVGVRASSRIRVDAAARPAGVRGQVYCRSDVRAAARHLSHSQGANGPARSGRIQSGRVTVKTGTNIVVECDGSAPKSDTER